MSARWHIKKLARRAAACLGRGLDLVGPATIAPAVRAITYHRFGNRPRDPFCVSSCAFETQIRWLAENGLAISHSELLDFVRGVKELRSGSVLVTIDDGYASVAQIAAPILKEYAVPAAIYVTTGLVGNDMAAAGQPERYMSWQDVEQLHGSGFLIGSHSHTHRSLGSISATEAKDELSISYQTIRDRLGMPPISFAYPFGTPAHYSVATGAAIASVGYLSGFVSTHGSISVGATSTELPRVKIEGGESLEFFKHSCCGAMDLWRYVDHAVCIVRRSYPSPRS